MFLSYKIIKLKLRVFLAGMVNYIACATNFTVTWSPMIGQYFDTVILASTDIQSGYNDPSNSKSWKLFRATLKTSLCKNVILRR